MRIGFVSSGGGHLAHLLWLRPWWEAHDRVWVVPDAPEVRGALTGESLRFAAFPTNRNLANLARNAAHAPGLWASLRPDVVVSAGAGVAVPYLLAARLLGIPTVYLEGPDRLTHPSLTARLVHPFVDLLVLPDPSAAAALPRGRFLGGWW